MPKALIVIARQEFQDQEYAGTRKGLEEAGYELTIASTAAGICVGKFGKKEEATIALKSVDVEQFDRVAFIGGPGAAALADDEDAKRVARDTIAQGKVLGAICIAPTILARAGVLKGKKATVWDSGGEPHSAPGGASRGKQAQLLEECGATYTGEDVTVDGKIVTANGPPAAEEFGRTLATL